MLRIQIQICVVPNGHKVASLRRAGDRKEAGARCGPGKPGEPPEERSWEPGFTDRLEIYPERRNSAVCGGGGRKLFIRSPESRGVLGCLRMGQTPHPHPSYIACDLDQSSL